MTYVEQGLFHNSLPASDVFNKEWRDACDVRPVTKAEATPLIEQHYLGKWPGVCVLRLGLICGSELLGVLVFALPPRETNKRYGGETLELARLWVDDRVPRNAETWFIGKGVKHVKKTMPTVRFLVSYADPSQGHRGTIYKAANWLVDGRTDEGRKTPRMDYVCAVSGKKYSRRAHIPAGLEVNRVPRISKLRFYLKVSA